MITNKLTNKQISLVLASQSIGRKLILRQMGIDFTIDPAHINEEAYKINSPRKLVKILATEKAKFIAGKHSRCLILGADTIVVRAGKIIGKPQNEQHAKSMLAELSGVTHEVYTGLALIDTTSGKNSIRSTRSSVTFNKLSQQQIEDYLASNEWIGKAGGYSSQESGGKTLIKKITGDTTNVVGLPKKLFLNMLRDLKLEIKEK